MKRSRINQVIKDMEALAKENGFICRRFAAGRRKSGMKKVMSVTRSVTIN